MNLLRLLAPRPVEVVVFGTGRRVVDLVDLVSCAAELPSTAAAAAALEADRSTRPDASTSTFPPPPVPLTLASSSFSLMLLLVRAGLVTAFAVSDGTFSSTGLLFGADWTPSAR